MIVVPDTSVVVDGRLSERVESGEYEGATVSVPEVVVSELEAQANRGFDTGFDGIEELDRLATLAGEGRVDVEYAGDRPGPAATEAASEGELDAAIRDHAADLGATLLTSDRVQSRVARAKGEFDVELLEPRTSEVEALSVAEFFDEQTMSVHLRTGVRPMAKRGAVGEMQFEAVDDDPLTDAELEAYATEIESAARASEDGFVELSEPGMTIVQFREYRVAIARPPFSDAREITAVRPVVKTDLDDYEFAEDLRERLLEGSRGVLISGSPGAGKSTFAQAVAEFLADGGFSVKTMEKPRDLQVREDVTQYTALDGSMAKTADALLMVRPDYTVFDEVRKTDDFEVFADMRLAGVGMVGVVHATRAIDALQRLVGRVELGMIPQIVDTVVYIEEGRVDTVYDVSTEVKVPEGLTEEDLTRPVITVREFQTGRPEYEIYSFNRQVVTVPIGDGDGGETGVDRIARSEIEREVRAIARGHVEVEVTGPNSAIVYVEDDDISQVIGKGGRRVSGVEDRLGMEIDVRTHDERPGQGQGQGQGRSGGPGGGGDPARHTPGEGELVAPEITGQHVVVPAQGYEGETVEIRAGEVYVCTATVSRGGEVQVSRGSAIAEEIERAVDRGHEVRVVPS
ncbi:ATPase [Halobacteriales archaeon SW_5_70_135]|nr:MAG: ATPase [Halobacteriales archaeon SW_5_70_135]